MKTSRPSIDNLLNPKKSVTILTLAKAAKILGKELSLV